MKLIYRNIWQYSEKISQYIAIRFYRIVTLLFDMPTMSTYPTFSAFRPVSVRSRHLSTPTIFLQMHYHPFCMIKEALVISTQTLMLK